jgi:hypothetical protein
MHEMNGSRHIVGGVVVGSTLLGLPVVWCRTVGQPAAFGTIMRTITATWPAVEPVTRQRSAGRNGTLFQPPPRDDGPSAALVLKPYDPKL